jgi:hypothetical protein
MDYVEIVLSLVNLFCIVFVVTCFGGSSSGEAAKIKFIYKKSNIFIG